MNMTSKLIAVIGVFCTFAVHAENLTVAAGQTETISEDKTYGTVTVNGTLNITGGTFDATALNIGSGVGETGLVVVNGGTLSMGSTKTISIGYNGGTGTLQIDKGTKNIANNIILGNGGNGGVGTLRLNGGTVQGNGVLTAENSGSSRIEFNGGMLKYTSYAFVSKGQLLTLASVSGKAIDFLSINAEKTPFDLRGPVVTEGDGCIRFSGNASKLILLANKKNDCGTITYGHMGGFVLEGELFRVDSADFFGGLDVSIKAGSTGVAPVLDLNGNAVSVGSFEVAGVVTNKASDSATLAVGAEVADKTSVFDVADMDGRIALVKKGASTLDFKQDSFFAPITISNGVFAVSSRVAVSNLTQAANGLVKIGSDGVLEFHGDMWTAPAFAADSVGPVETIGGVGRVQTINTPGVAFKGDLSVKSGKLDVINLGGPVGDRYFRFTMKASSYHHTEMALERFRLLDESGNVISDGLTEAAVGTPAALLAPGTVAFSDTYTQHFSSNVANLFDGQLGTWIFFKDTNAEFWPTNIANNTWRTFVFRLPADVTAPVAKFQLTSPHQNANTRTVAAWSLESSPDGVNWQMLDDRLARTPSTENTDYGPFSFTNTVKGVATNISFPTTANLSVASGASVDFKATVCTVPGLAVDMSAYAGGSATISGFQPLADGQRIELTNVTGAAPYALPILFDGLADGKYGNWTASVDGASESNWQMKVRGGVASIGPVPGLILLFR